MDFGQSCVAHLNGEVAAGNHHSDCWGAHRAQENFGEVRKTCLRLDLEHDSQTFYVEAR